MRLPAPGFHISGAQTLPCRPPLPRETASKAAFPENAFPNKGNPISAIRFRLSKHETFFPFYPPINNPALMRPKGCRHEKETS